MGEAYELLCDQRRRHDIEIFDYEGPFRDSFEICVQPNREYRVGVAMWTSEADQVLCDSHAISFEPHRNWKVERQGHIEGKKYVCIAWAGNFTQHLY